MNKEEIIKEVIAIYDIINQVHIDRIKAKKQIIKLKTIIEEEV